jgi:hypothetical protein
MEFEAMTAEQAQEIGAMCRNAKDGNLLVGAFAAEMIGESYPFSKAMCKIVFDGHTDEALGRKFGEWCDRD